MSYKSSTGRRLIAVSIALCLVVAACGDDDAEGTSASDSSPTADESGGADSTDDDTLGESNPASGEPVKVGLITELGSEAIGAQSQLTLDGAEIGVEYVNEYLGGITGRPIELVHCGNKATPAGAQDCANQMIEEGVVAVVMPFSGQSAAQAPIIVGAGIPYVIGSGTTPEDLATQGAFSTTGGYVGTLGVVAKHAAENGVEKLAHVVIEVPTAVTAARDVGGIVFGNADVDYEVIPVAPGTPDMSPQLQAAASSGAEAVMVTGDLTFCTAFLQAYETLGLELHKYVIATCVDPSVLESVPGAFDGASMATATDPESEDADIYGAVVQEYGSADIDPDPTASNGIAAGVSTIVNFVRFMDGLDGEVTKESVLAQMTAATDVELFLGGGATATCDGSAISILPSVCSAALQMAVLDAEGKPTNSTSVDAGELFKV